MKQIFALLLLSIAIAAPAGASTPAPNSSLASQTITVIRAVTIRAEPDIVWSTVRDYDAPSVWDASITSTTLTGGSNNTPGATRHMTLADGGTVDDRLTKWNADSRTFAVRLKRADLPVRAYRASLQVASAPNGQSRVVWRARFKPADGKSAATARNAIAKRLHKALVHLHSMLGTGGDAAGSGT